MYVLNPPGLGFLTRDEEMQFLLCLIIFVTRPIYSPSPVCCSDGTLVTHRTPGGCPVCPAGQPSPALVPRPLGHCVGSPGTVGRSSRPLLVFRSVLAPLGSLVFYVTWQVS